MRKHTMGIAWMAAAIVVICASAPLEAAQGKGSGGGSGSTTTTTGGTTGTTGSKIYFHDVATSSATASNMNPDGTAKIAMFGFERRYGIECSTALQGGKRWFAQLADPGWDNYEYAPEIRFFSDTGETHVFALDFGTLDAEWIFAARWVPGDAEISFASRRIVDGLVTEVGVFAVQVQFTDGVPSAISAPYLKVATPTITEDDGRMLPAVLGGYDWSPSGNALICSNLQFVITGDTTELYVLSGTGAQVIRNSGRDPRWAPGATNRITYLENGAVCTIGADGSGWKSVVAAPKSTSKSQQWLWSPQWSTDSASITYGHQIASTNGGSQTVYKVGASGSGKTSLGAGRPFAWK